MDSLIEVIPAIHAVTGDWPVYVICGVLIALTYRWFINDISH